MAVHESLEQRIVLKHHVGALERDEINEYITHHLKRAGTELPLFSPEAQEAVSQATQGLPRRINRLCHYALMAAAASKAKTVGAEHVETAAAEVGR